MRSSLALCFGFLTLVASGVAAQERALPAPSEPNSHQAYSEALAAQQAEGYARLLARYDQELARAPQLVTALERCHFLSSNAAGDEDELSLEEPVASDSACFEQLAHDYPDEPAAIFAALDNLYGPQRIAFARELLSSPSALAPAELARVRQKLAFELDAQGELDDAVREASLVRQVRPDLDVSLVLGRRALALGRRREAVALLSAQLEQTEPHSALRSKAKLLSDADAFEPAQRALTLLAEQPDAFQDTALRAHVLERLGRHEQARDAYRELTKGYLRPSALRHLFELENSYGTGEHALQAYQEMRDDGFAADPFLRRRLSLFWAHPGERFATRDLLGLLALLALLAAAAALPLVALVPVHYVGLILRERAQRARLLQLPPREGPVTLARTGTLFGALFASQVLAFYVWAPDQLDGWFEASGTERPSDGALTRAVITAGLGGLLIVGFSVGREPLRVLLRRHGPLGENAGRIARAWGLVFLCALGNRLLVSALGLSDVEEAIDVEGALVSTLEMLRAVFRTLGFPALALVAVICAPFVEELSFRYMLSDAVARHLPFRAANYVQATVFALCHDQWTYWPTLFYLALLAGGLRKESGSLLPSIGLHAAWNLMAISALTARGH